MQDSPVSRSVHGGQRRQVVRAAEVSVQPVLSGRQVSGGGRGGAGGRGEELHGGSVMGGAGASVHPWATSEDQLVVTMSFMILRYLPSVLFVLKETF